MKAVVIGSGVAGLASAIRLRCQGLEVHVFEANAYPGGKLSEFSLDGYRFEAGPSLFTLPYLVDDLLQSFL
jgi:phytoene dehydrogenase-like protein